MQSDEKLDYGRAFEHRPGAICRSFQLQSESMSEPRSKTSPPRRQLGLTRTFLPFNNNIVCPERVKNVIRYEISIMPFVLRTPRTSRNSGRPRLNFGSTWLDARRGVPQNLLNSGLYGGNKAGGSDVDGKIQNQHDFADSERNDSNNLRTKHP
jgi:hypothetical protein